jgi:hypothetical protein
MRGHKLGGLDFNPANLQCLPQVTSFTYQLDKSNGAVKNIYSRHLLDAI